MFSWISSWFYNLWFCLRLWTESLIQSLRMDKPQQLMQQSLRMDKQQQRIQQSLRRDRRLFSTMDEAVLRKQILDTHEPDGREVDVMPILPLLEDIFQLTGHTTSNTPENNDTSRSQATSSRNIPKAFAYTIHKISSKISSECLSGSSDSHAIAVALLSILARYSWDAKLVLTIAAFAVNYGEFYHFAEHLQRNNLAKLISMLKYDHLPQGRDHNNDSFIRQKNLIKSMLDVTKCIVQLNVVPAQQPYQSKKINANTTAVTDGNHASVAAILSDDIPIAVYQAMRSVVACMSEIISLTGFGHECIQLTMETSENSKLLPGKLNDIHGHLSKQLETQQPQQGYRIRCYVQDDILSLIHMLPFIDCTNMKRVPLNWLLTTTVLVLISDIEITYTEILMLANIFKETSRLPKNPEYELVWVPIVNSSIPWTKANEEQFQKLQTMMPWYSVSHPMHPFLIDQAVVKNIKEKWHFDKKPILVVSDPQGNVVNLNALHMIWIWGSLAYPFTSSREEALWKEEVWRLELLFGGTGPKVTRWIAEKKTICVYGGEDIEWIRKFTTKARAIAQEAGFLLELVYVGKSKPGELVREIIATISLEKLGYSLQDLSSIRFFWVRLESMWHSKMQLGNTTEENDPIMKETRKMLDFDGSGKCWATFNNPVTGMGLNLNANQIDQILKK
ncbi:hypothetical protein MKW94_018514 [Papaver nudicaule]|uniref:Uncharacterized protein n=1 Tax=Papaver nudicaule TaxID=74823 RepID=A0AA41S3Y3_PAPNU|nr:hypothetical protein [Papaver nudicaule]